MDPDKIKKIRLEKGYTLADVSQYTGYTASFLSQLERGLKKPSIESLRKICKCLDVPIFSFFIDEESSQKENNNGNAMCTVIHGNNRNKINIPEIPIEYELLTPISTNKNITEITGFYLEINPGCLSSEKLVSHSDDESMFVIKGKITALVGDSEYELKVGDSIYINKNSPHNLLNSSDEVSACIIYTKKII